MKKHLFIYALATLVAGGFVASCSDDDPEIDIPEVPEKPDPEPEPEPEPEPVVCPIASGTVFSDGLGLDLKYSNAPLLGKQVKFVVSETDATKATLVLSGAKLSAESMPIPLPISGNSSVIPGEETTSLNVNLVINGDKVTFEGKDEVAGRIINYKGEGTKTALSLDLQVTMPQSELTNQKFGLLAFKQDKTAPITLNWDSQAKLSILGLPQPVQNVLNLVSMIGFPTEGTTEKLNINQLLAGVLNTISFLPDGNIQASYKDQPVGGEWKNSPVNMATYTVDAENKIVNLYINVPQIIAYETAQSKSRAGEESDSKKIMAELIQNALALVNKVLTAGIPVSYEVKDGVYSFFLDENTLLPILQMIKPVLENEEIMATLMKLIKQSIATKDPALAEQLPAIIEPVLKSFPEVINQTKSMRFGLNLVAGEK